MPKALIAEDEPNLRVQLRDALAAVWPELDVCALAGDGLEALRAVETHAPDIAFLDIRMPGLSGFDVARQIADRCHLVFVTAHDEYAIAAFEHGALDYVLKPVETARLATTVTRLKLRLRERPADLRGFWDRLDAEKSAAHIRWIQASTGNKIRFIAVNDVAYFQSDAKYTRVVTREATAHIRKTIKELVAELDGERFWQIHRATIINVDRIAAVTRHLDGRMDVALRESADVLPVSRMYQFRFRQM